MPPVTPEAGRAVKIVSPLDSNLTAFPTAVHPWAGHLHPISFYFFARTRLHYFLNGPGIIGIVGIKVPSRCHTSLTFPVLVEAGLIWTWESYQHIGVLSAWGQLASRLVLVNGPNSEPSLLKGT